MSMSSRPAQPRQAQPRQAQPRQSQPPIRKTARGAGPGISPSPEAQRILAQMRAARRPDWVTRHAALVGVILGMAALVTVLVALLLALHFDNDAVQVGAVILGALGVAKAVIGGLLLGEERMR